MIHKYFFSWFCMFEVRIPDLSSFPAPFTLHQRVPMCTHRWLSWGGMLARVKLDVTVWSHLEGGNLSGESIPAKLACGKSVAYFLD